MEFNEWNFDSWHHWRSVDDKKISLSLSLSEGILSSRRERERIIISIRRLKIPFSSVLSSAHLSAVCVCCFRMYQLTWESPELVFFSPADFYHLLWSGLRIRTQDSIKQQKAGVSSVPRPLWNSGVITAPDDDDDDHYALWSWRDDQNFRLLEQKTKKNPARIMTRHLKKIHSVNWRRRTSCCCIRPLSSPHP